MNEFATQPHVYKELTLLKTMIGASIFACDKCRPITITGRRRCGPGEALIHNYVWEEDVVAEGVAWAATFLGVRCVNCLFRMVGIGWSALQKREPMDFISLIPACWKPAPSGSTVPDAGEFIDARPAAGNLLTVQTTTFHAACQGCNRHRDAVCIHPRCTWHRILLTRAVAYVAHFLGFTDIVDGCKDAPDQAPKLGQVLATLHWLCREIRCCSICAMHIHIDTMMSALNTDPGPESEKDSCGGILMEMLAQKSSYPDARLCLLQESLGLRTTQGMDIATWIKYNCWPDTCVQMARALVVKDVAFTRRVVWPEWLLARVDASPSQDEEMTDSE